MKPTTFAALSVCLTILCLPAHGQAQSPVRKQGDPAVLREAFKALEEELIAALAEYTAASEAARARGVPEDQLPKIPTKDFFPRFEDLALQDQPDALRWCMGTVNMLELDMDATNARKYSFYERMVRVHPNSPWMKDVVRFMEEEGPPMGVGLDRILPLLDSVVEHSTTPTVRSQALLTKARLYQKSPDPEHKDLAIPVLRVVAEKYPQTEEAKRARAFLFHVDNLSVGKTPPDFTTKDVDGVPFKLSDYRGKVVVLDFWGFWCPKCVLMLPLEKEMVTRLANEPFALIGINTDESKELYKQKAVEHGVTWRNSWQGSRVTGPLVNAWSITKYPTVLVLDAQGVVRYKDLKGDSLAQAVDALLLEMKTPPGDKSGQPASGEKAPGKTGG